MAEDRIYRSRGYVLDKPATLQLTNVQESIRGSQTLQKRLDQVSEMALGKLKTQAEREGELYGVTHQISAQQLSDAIANDIDLNTLMESTDTVFGEKANEIQASALTQLLINQFNLEMSNMKAGLETMDPDEVVMTTQAMQEGYARVIERYSPKLGIKFRASSGITGKQLIDDSLEIENKRHKENVKVSINQQMNVVRGNYTDILKRNTNPIDIAALTTVMDTNMDALFKQDPDNYSKHDKDYQEMKKKVFESTIVNYVVENKLTNNFLKGDFGKYNAVIIAEDMNDNETIDRIRKAIINKQDETAQIVSKQKAYEAAMKDEESLVVFSQFYQNKITDKELFDKLKAIDYPLTKDLYKQIRTDAQPTEMQDDNAAVLKYQIESGGSNTQKINQLIREGKITHKQGVEAKNQLFKELGELKGPYNRIYTIFKKDELQYKLLDRNNPVRSLIDKSKLELERRRDAAMKAEAEGRTVDFDPEKVAEEIALANVAEYAKQKVDPTIKNVRKYLSKTNLSDISAEDFAKMTNEEITQIVTKDKKKFSNKRYELLIDKRDKIKSLLNGEIAE